MKEMVVRIRLQRLGQRNLPFYRIVVADSRAPRDGRFIENVRGTLHPVLFCVISQVPLFSMRTQDWHVQPHPHEGQYQRNHGQLGAGKVLGRQRSATIGTGRVVAGRYGHPAATVYAAIDQVLDSQIAAKEGQGMRRSSFCI